MIPVNASRFGRAGGRRRRYPGGTENASISATVRVDPITPRVLLIFRISDREFVEGNGRAAGGKTRKMVRKKIAAAFESMGVSSEYLSKRALP
jgi:hypothetical protein